MTPPAASAADRLESWKEIAAYLKRGVRTVRRWEKEEGLPVRRHQHQKLGSVFAYKSEVDAWWASRQPRLEADVEEPAAHAIPWMRRPRTFVVALALAAGLAAAAAFWAWPRSAESPPGAGRIMLAVLPLENLSGDPDQEFFSDGLTEEMITALGRARPDRLGVIARTSVIPYKQTSKSARQIGAELGVAYLLEGSVRREGGRVRIATQLIRASDQTQLWSENYDRDLAGILDMQLEVAGAVAGQIQLTLAPDQQSLSNRVRSVNPEALEATLKGRYFLERRTAEDIRKAQQFFERAIALDAGHALAYVGLADAHMLAITYADATPKEAMARSRQAVLRALELDGRLPAAHAWLGIILTEYDWDWVAAERSFRRAIDLNPSFAYAHKLYAEYLSYVGRFEESIAEARLFRQLDPLSIVANAQVGVVLYRARRYDESLAQLSQTIEMDPDHPLAFLPQGLAFSMKGMHREAAAALSRGLALSDDSSEMIAQLAFAHGRAGRRDEARTLLERLRARARTQHVSPFVFAVAHVGLNESQAAMDWLEKAYAARDWYLCVLKTDPIFDPLRRDARYQDLLRRMNFPA